MGSSRVVQAYLIRLYSTEIQEHDQGEVPGQGAKVGMLGRQNYRNFG